MSNYYSDYGYIVLVIHELDSYQANEKSLVNQTL